MLYTDMRAPLCLPALKALRSLVMYSKTDFIGPALAVSLALHLILGWVMSRPVFIRLPEAKIIDVELTAALPTPVKRQIVSPPDQKTEKPPEQTNQLSDRDYYTPKETIRRGDPTAGAPSKVTTPTKAAASQQAKPVTKTMEPNPQTQPATAKQVRKSATNQKLDLSTDYGLLSDLSKKAERKKDSNANAVNVPQPFSRAPGSSARIFGFYGSLDHLPNVTDGDITLLNAKADKFAVFVRRVAIRVFNLLKQYGWDYLSARDFISLNRFSTIRATMDPSGKFVSLSIEASSGNTGFDRILERSVSEGASDPNPPAAAKAADGNYRFIFQARSWSETYPGGRAPTGRPIPPQERRWLMLQTGLE